MGFGNILKELVILMPTIKQKRACKEVVENGGNVSKGMRAVGYSKATAKNPKKLTDSKGWQELMEQYLPDKDLAKKHKALLEKKEIVIRNNNKTGKIEIIKTGEIDAQAVKAGLDMGYKLKGKYKPTEFKVLDNNEAKTDDEIKRDIERLRERRRKLTTSSRRKKVRKSSKTKKKK